MTLIFALAAAALFGVGAYLVLDRDLLRMVLGIVVISHAATITVIASALTRGAAPILPFRDGAVADPLSHAMALTAIVIGLALTALLLALVLRVVRAYRSKELDEVADEEAEREARLERRTARAHEDEEEATAR
jgi:multicomponent Na+:H+ antiporter subunit C